MEINDSLKNFIDIATEYINTYSENQAYVDTCRNQ